MSSFSGIPLPPADLHVHTWFSDGKLPPARVVEIALRGGIRTLAITDHETVAGIAEARAAGSRMGVEVVPGIEFATSLKGAEPHLLGLWIDPRHPAIARAVAGVEEERRARMERMVEKLNALGFRITMEEVEKVPREGALSRPHLAQAMVEKGLVRTFSDAFARFIGNHGPAYVARRRFPPEEAIGVIHEAGGLAVLAHGLVGGMTTGHVEALAEMGIDGVEVCHPKLGEKERKWLSEFAERKGLAKTAGSDWHGEGWSEGRPGEFTVDRAGLEVLLGRLYEKSRGKPGLT